MVRIIAAVLTVSFALPAAASPTPHRARRRVLPSTAAADQQSFDQTYDFLLAQAGQSYLKGQLMPDPAVLEPFLAQLKDPQLGKAKSDLERLQDLISNAEAVQAGPGSVAPDVYKMMIDQASDDLGVGAIAEEEFVPNARAGRSLDADEKALVSACQAEARDKAYDRRGFYEKCLGHRRAEAVYLSGTRAASGDGSQNPAALRLIQEIEAGRAKHAQTATDVDRLLKDTQTRLMAALPSVESSVTGAAPRFQRLTPTPKGSTTPLFAQAKGLKINEPPLSSIDLNAGVNLARVAKADEIGFTGYCYSYVKAALQKAGIVNRSVIDSSADAGHARMFADFVDKNPALLKRKLHRVKTPSWPLPIGTIVVWSAGACNYSKISGHIEIITRIKPPQACSDGCETFQTACLDQLGSDPARALSELPQAQDDVRKAQSAVDSASDRRSRLQAAADLKTKQKALASVQARQTPAVAVYVIERDQAPPAQTPLVATN
jgi:hypothetical protein